MKLLSVAVKTTTTFAVMVSGVLSLVLGMLLVGGYALQGKSANANHAFLQNEGANANQDFLQDGKNAKLTHLEHMNRARFIEIFLVGSDPTKTYLPTSVYNTLLSPGFDPATSRDSAPQSYVEGINVQQIKEQYHALAAVLNGPKLYLFDWVDVPVGAEREFNGKKLAWVAEGRLNPEVVKKGKAVSEDYVPTQIERSTKIGYNKGTLAFLIDDASGNTWIIKGMEQGLKPTHTYEEFAANGASLFKKLPPGWKFRTKVLDKDLVLVPESGVATIMPDEFSSVYDKTGPGYSNYKP